MTTAPHRYRIPDETIAAIPADAWHALTEWVGTTDLDTVYVSDIDTGEGRTYSTADPRIAHALEVLATDGWPALAELIGYHEATLEDFVDAMGHTITELANRSENNTTLDLDTAPLCHALDELTAHPTWQDHHTAELEALSTELKTRAARWAEAWTEVLNALADLTAELPDDTAPTQRLGYHTAPYPRDDRGAPPCHEVPPSADTRTAPSSPPPDTPSAPSTSPSHGPPPPAELASLETGRALSAASSTETATAATSAVATPDRSTTSSPETTTATPTSPPSAIHATPPSPLERATPPANADGEPLGSGPTPTPNEDR